MNDLLIVKNRITKRLLENQCNIKDFLTNTKTCN